MKKRVFSLVLTILLAVSCFSISTVSADSLYVRKVVSVVYDDSGSMSEGSSMNWSYANYAMQTLCGLLNADDELYITYMSNPGTAVMPTDFASNRQVAVDNIRNTLDSGNTPQASIDTAKSKLVESYNSNVSSSVKTEYWLVVLTDGAFNGEGAFGKPELDSALQSFAQSQMGVGMDLHTIYLAIGSKAIEAASDASLNIIAKKCDDGKAIVAVLSELSNAISGRYRLSKDDITLVNDNTVEVTSEIPLLNIALLMQNSSATLSSLVKDDGTALQIDQQVTLKNPEKSGWTSDSNLHGKALLVGNAGQNIPAGKYTLTFTDKVDINALDIMFEPALELHMAVMQNGKEITDLSSLRELDKIDVQMKLCEAGTNKEIDIALLKGDATYKLGYKENDVDINSSDSMTMSGITLKDLKTDIYGTFTFGGFIPLTIAVEISPSSFESNYELRLSVTKDGKEVTDLSQLHEKDVISVTSHLFDIFSGTEVDISTLGTGVINSIGYSEADTEILSVQGTNLSDISLKPVKTDVYAAFQLDMSAPPLSASLTLNPIKAVVYGLTVEVPDDYIVDREDISTNSKEIRFVITGDGVPLAKEEVKDLPFTISLDRKIPYTLQQEEDGSFSFRPKVEGSLMSYPTGDFTVTGKLNNTISKSGIFTIGKGNLLLYYLNEYGVKTLIALLILLLILGYVPGIKKYLPKRLKKRPLIHCTPMGIGGGAPVDNHGAFSKDLSSTLIPYRAETGTLRYVPSGVTGFPSLTLRAAGGNGVFITNTRALAGRSSLEIDGMSIPEDVRSMIRKSANMNITATTKPMMYECTPKT